MTTGGLPRRGIRRRGDHWLWVGGPVPPGSAAITIWRLISVRRRFAGDAVLLRHEEEHVRQWRELGPARFLREYLGSYVANRRKGFGHRAAYRLIPLEIEAYDVAASFSREENRPDAVVDFPDPPR